MDISFLLKNLNEKQLEVVSAPDDVNLLVLAGAGSGKTSVLVYRIIWLISVKKKPPFSILAVTFTNKAALEMKQRINQLLIIKEEIWIGTFHSLAYRLLRKHYMYVNLPKDFQILDNDDQICLIRRLLNVLNLDEKKWSPSNCLKYINTKKNNGIRPYNIKIYDDKIEETFLKIYQIYQDTCDRSGLVDFSELLLRAYELWLNKPDILQNYRNRFKNVFIDEFQDTNTIQYIWFSKLVGDKGNVMIVGDDDQSIYGWRGAEIENIKRIFNDFSNLKIIRLEQNYRSTNNILKAANALISNNSIRMGKNLWTNCDNGEPILIYCAFNDLDEALYVVEQIEKIYKNNGMLKNCAILYRRNIQSRLLEEVLIQKRIPYKICGGKRFFERKEIKEVLSYLRLILNSNDDSSFERIINIPHRDIGKMTLSIIRQFSSKQQLTLWKTCEYLLFKNMFSKRANIAIKHFLELIMLLKNEIQNNPLHIQVSKVIEISGLLEMYKQEKNEKSQNRIDNLNELLKLTFNFSVQDEYRDLHLLQAFLSYVALNSNEEKTNLDQDAVQLMTLHSAKGLEFPIVFIIGAEEGLFPSQMSMLKNKRVEEERRLAYVGITRAMKKLTITYAETRRLYGKNIFLRPSRFIKELPKECIKKSIFRDKKF
ncbi:DNA helicase II [Candidatus Providencia siddallii]|uniref:DNA 3'-5' helicase n=1 Tax=Candidatus Providencia siddallii TaxID=1715285 RepID=A0ABM9NNA6_9GAMM